MNPRTFLLWALTSLTLATAAAGSPMPATGSATATFVRTDTTTQGTWKNVYGTDGYSVADTSPSKIPSYATFTPENQANYTWTTNGGETRDLEVAWASPTDQRQASCWYTYYGNSFDLNVDFTDGNAHELALYALDWDKAGRAETIQVVDANTNAVLDTRSLSNFTNGIYLIWNISGHVKVNVTHVSGPNAVISAAMFAPAASTNTAATATASFVKTDTTTEGNWEGTYGADGHSIANSSQSVPSYATFGVQNEQNYTWAASTSDIRALETGSASARIASTWYGDPKFNFDVNFTDGKTHQLTLYALDWDSYVGTRVETVQIVDATTGALIDSRALLSFVNGTYLVWNVSGHVKINVILNSAGNAVISGVFFGTGTPGTTSPTITTTPATTTATTAVANFVTSDTSSEGTWKAKYGVDGYSIANDSQSIPAYAIFAVQNQQNYTWASNTSDLRALQTGSGSGRIAATWFNNSAFNFDINLTDGKSHQIALYGLDWDNYEGGRAEKIQIVDAGSSAVLDTRTISGFTNGIYLAWNITGHVKINVVLTGNGNAVISGVFFGGAGAVAPPTGVPQPGSVAATQPVSQTQTAPSSAPSTATTISQPAAAHGTLTLTPTSFNFRTVTIGATATQPFTVSNSGTGSVTISNVSLSGPGLTANGISTGTTLTPGQSATLNVTYAPASAGASSGSVTFSSNATNASATIGLTGTGAQPAPVVHSVDLSWAPSASSTVVAYDVYRGTAAAGPFTLVTSGSVAATSYVDTTGQVGQTYYYAVTSVDSSNDQSLYSNVVSATIP